MNGKSSTAERKGGLRYPKQIYFASNIVVLDLILNSFPDDILKESLCKWLNNQHSSDLEFENKVCSFLSVSSAFTQFKIRDNEGKEIYFQTEGIYKAIIEGAKDVSVDDSKENVGPTRIYKNVIKEDLEPWIKQSDNGLCFKETSKISPKDFLQIISTTLDISNVKDEAISQNIENCVINRISALPGQNSKFAALLTALRTKPFVLLAGISGTGKSRIVRELARACWENGSDEYKAHKPRNFEMIQVKPNWHDSSELLGYVSRIGEEPEFVAGEFLKFVVKAWSEPDVPYFLCLDEMNLAPVEQYFAEYLSVIESRKLEKGMIVTDPILRKENQQWYHTLVSLLTESNEELHTQFLNEGITIPQNLFVVGTVNMDETTFSFSRKVLDRAMTIEMNEVDLNEGLDENEDDEFGYIGNSIIPQVVEGKDVYVENKKICDDVIDFLKKVNDVLDRTPFKIAYRTRNEFLVYAVCRGEENLNNALDEMTSMKILSRIEGDADKTERVLKDMENLLKSYFENLEKSVSLAKIEEMIGKLDRTQYTSFWS
ncbi:MAG: AAA family ATPase [Paludibacteraceae bacterium]|nr:AAA family ATPase [Paludibacteraceae bacterium]